MALAREHSRTGEFSGTLSNSDGGHKPAGPGGGIVQPQCGWKSLDAWDSGGMERHYILQVLRQVGGVISGSDGAAAKLGMKRTTLQSKMLRLGISKEDVN